MCVVVVLMHAHRFSVIFFCNKLILVCVCVYMWTRSFLLFSSIRCVRMSIFVYVCVCMCQFLCLYLYMGEGFHDSVLHSGLRAGLRATTASLRAGMYISSNATPSPVRCHDSKLA